MSCTTRSIQMSVKEATPLTLKPNKKKESIILDSCRDAKQIIDGNKKIRFLFQTVIPIISSLRFSIFNIEDYGDWLTFGACFKWTVNFGISTLASFFSLQGCCLWNKDSDCGCFWHTEKAQCSFQTDSDNVPPGSRPIISLPMKTLTTMKNAKMRYFWLPEQLKLNSKLY